jgi:hypothetical protein
MSSVMFWQLPSTPHYYWSTLIAPSSSRSEIRAVRRKSNCQLKFSSSAWVRAAVCGTHCHGGALWALWMSAFHGFVLKGPMQCFFSVLQYASDVIVVPYFMNSTIRTPFLSQKTVVICFLADNVCLNFFGFFGEWVHPLLWLLFGFYIHKWNPGFITCYLYDVIEKFMLSFWYCSKESKPKLFSVFYMHLWAFSEPILCITCA